jgi:hypothetical protein
MKRRLVAAVAVVSTSVGLSIVSASPIQGAAAVTVTGKLGAAASGWKVVMVGAGGQSLVSAVDTGGSFSLRTSATAAKRATLQMVDSSNRYVGPIVIGKEKVGKSTCSHHQLAGKSVKLGTLKLNTAQGFAIPSKAPKSTVHTRSAVLAKGTSGQPLSAGTAGIVKVTTAQMNACGKAVKGTSIATSQDANITMGGDLDNDGLPNALDADDDGDQEVDAIDKTTTESAGMNPWIAVRSSNPLFNASVSTGLTPENVNSVLGTSGNYSIQFFVGNRNLLGQASLNGVKWVWVDCGNLVYCGGSAPTATNTNTHLQNSNTGVAWKSYNGGFKVESTGSPATSGLDTSLGTNPGGNGNALYLGNRNTGNDPGGSVYWQASVFPNQGANTLTNVKPGDVYTLRFGTDDGEKSVTMMLNPHAVTVPGLTTVNGAAYTGGALKPDASGKLALKFFRPQRLATTGETGTFKDMGGLRYGIIFMGQMDTPCDIATYSAYDAFTPATGPDASDMGNRLAPLTDKQTTDSDTSASATQLSFTIDVRSCIGAATYDAAAAGTSWGIQLNASGQMLTGGMNRASLDLTVTK